MLRLQVENRFVAKRPHAAEILCAPEAGINGKAMMRRVSNRMCIKPCRYQSTLGASMGSCEPQSRPAIGESPHEHLDEHSCKPAVVKHPGTSVTRPHRHKSNQTPTPRGPSLSHQFVFVRTGARASHPTSSASSVGACHTFPGGLCRN